MVRSVDLDFVYIIGVKGRDVVKVGWAKNPRQRLKDLQAGCPDELFIKKVFACPPGTAQQYEKNLHRKLDDYRIRGEWFREEAPLIAKMMAIAGDGHMLTRRELVRVAAWWDELNRPPQQEETPPKKASTRWWVDQETGYPVFG